MHNTMFYHVLSSMLRYQGFGFIFGDFIFAFDISAVPPLHLWDRRMTKTNELWPAGRTFSAQNKVTILQANNQARATHRQNICRMHLWNFG